MGSASLSTAAADPRERSRDSDSRCLGAARDWTGGHRKLACGRRRNSCRPDPRVGRGGIPRMESLGPVRSAKRFFSARCSPLEGSPHCPECGRPRRVQRRRHGSHVGRRTGPGFAVPPGLVWWRREASIDSAGPGGPYRASFIRAHRWGRWNFTSVHLPGARRHFRSGCGASLGVWDRNADAAHGPAVSKRPRSVMPGSGPGHRLRNCGTPSGWAHWRGAAMSLTTMRATTPAGLIVNRSL